MSDYPLEGYKADFTRVNDEAYQRYVRLCSIDFDKRITALRTGTFADVFLTRLEIALF